MLCSTGGETGLSFANLLQSYDTAVLAAFHRVLVFFLQCIGPWKILFLGLVPWLALLGLPGHEVSPITGFLHSLCLFSRAHVANLGRLCGQAA